MDVDDVVPLIMKKNHRLVYYCLEFVKKTYKVSSSSNFTVGIQQMLLLWSHQTGTTAGLEYSSYFLPCSILQNSFTQEVSEVMLCSICKRKLRLQNDILLRLQIHSPVYHWVGEDGELFASIGF